MKLLKKLGATSEIWQIFIQDSSSTTGAGLTGLANNTSGLTAYYHRDTDTTATAITLATMTVGTFTSSGFKEIDATNMPGWYQFCPPNAALASGAKSCAFHLKGATNMAPLPIECQLTGVDVDDAVRGGMTALPNANAAASGGLWILGSNNTAAITIGALTVGAISGTTLTFSGAVAFQSTFTVTTSTSLGALSCTTLTASGAVALQSTVTLASLTVTGAVAFQSTWTVTGAVVFSSTFATTGTTTFNALTVTNAFTVSGTTTLTGTFTASNASNNIVGIDAAKINGNATAAANLATAYGGLEIGTAQSGGPSTITIRAGAVGTTNYWANQSIYLTGGTGGGQTNKVVSSSGQTLTVETAWTVQPDNTTTYIVLGRIG